MREVDRTFAQLGWHFDENQSHDIQPADPPTVETVFRAMRLLEQYYARYTPNELPEGTVLTEPEEVEKPETDAGPIEVTELAKMEKPFIVRQFCFAHARSTR